MRIVGGKAGSRRLGGPSNRSIRPTSDRTREALFAVLRASYGCPEGAHVLDLFCGTGALALEALSQGAASAVLVDKSEEACSLAKKNAAALGFSVEVQRSDVLSFLRRQKSPTFSLVFVDPPYEKDLLPETLRALIPSLTEAAVVVVEHSSREETPIVQGLLLSETRTYGTTTLSLYVHEAQHKVTSMLSRRAQGLRPSPTLAAAAHAKLLLRQGVDIVDLTLGEPDFLAPIAAREAAREALAEGVGKYTEVAGILPLREALAERLGGDLGVSVSAGDVVVGIGVKQLLLQCLLALIDEGDEVLVPTPCWPSYVDQLGLMGGVPVFVPTLAEEGFVLSPERLAEVMTPKSKVLLLNSPSNPTGVALTAKDLRALAQVIRQHPRLVVLCDEIYQAIHFRGGRAPSLLQVAPDLRERVIVLDGASKAYAMTGWRLGWATGPSAVMAAVAAVQSQSTSCPVSFAQVGLLAALQQCRTVVDEMTAAFWKRRDLVVEMLSGIEGLSLVEPSGAFYAFPDLRAFLGRPRLSAYGDGEAALFRYLLEEGNVALLAGSAFAAEGFARLSFAVEEKRLQEGLSRLCRALTQLNTA